MAYSILGDVRDGDEIITTPYTMVATNTAILECGFKPVFADIKYETTNINPDDIEHRITDKTIGIVGVDYAGILCDWKEINKIASENGLLTVQDAAHSLGGKYYWFNAWGSITCFSFQATKHITTSDGGMFVTPSLLFYTLARAKNWFGIIKEDRIRNELGSYPDDIDLLGYKYAMNDVNAVMGIEGLKDFDVVFNRRMEIAKHYREELEGVDGLTLMVWEPHKVCANWMFPIHVEHRRNFAKQMRNEGIEVAVHNWRNDQYTIFGGKQNLPNTEKVNNNLIHIPLHAELTDEQVHYITTTIKGLKW